MSGAVGTNAAPTRWHTGDGAGFLAGWLDALAGGVPGATAALVLGQGPDGALRPLATWPRGAAPDAALAEALAATLDGAAPAAAVRDGPDPGTALVLQRVDRPDGPPGAVGLRVDADRTDAAAERLALGAGWLAAHLADSRAEAERARHARSFAALDLLSVVASRPRLPAAALALVAELPGALGVRRAALGLVRGNPARPPRLQALTGAAWFRRRGALVQALEDAMAEALDQLDTVAQPGVADRPRLVDVAHRAYRDICGAFAVASTVLLDDEDRPVGVLLIESDKALDEDTLLALETLAGLAGPVLALRRRQHAWVSGRGTDLARRGLRALGAPHRVSFRLATLAVIVALAAPFAITGPLRVTAEATVEGARQQAAAAPFAGFIAEAPVRAGDRVAEGALLMRLEDRDLRLEAEKWRSDLARLAQEDRQALIEGARSDRALILARTQRAEAELALALGRLARTEIRAPLAGVVVQGDHRERIGAPVEAGELLFEIASEDGLRLRLGIDERDLRLVEPGQAGVLVPRALTDLRVPVTVTRLTPVARDGVEGARLFEGEARLGETPEALQPGLEGVVRLDAGRASYAAIWTRRLRDWARLQLWRWTG